jgi:hypothetical protein
MEPRRRPAVESSGAAHRGFLSDGIDTGKAE